MPKKKKIVPAKVKAVTKPKKVVKEEKKAETTKTRKVIKAEKVETDFISAPEFIKPYSILNENCGTKMSVIDNTGRTIEVFESSNIKMNQIRAEEKFQEIK